MEYCVGTEKEALKLCRKLLRQGHADLFRGQTRDYPRLIPSLLRTTGKDYESARADLSLFKDWAHTVPQMARYHSSEESIVAIAQHYGIPTTFLDLTTEPEVALLFAKPETMRDGADSSVIYCFLESSLQHLRWGRTLRIDVGNLWRLEAQRGLFFEYLDEDKAGDLRSLAARIYFPANPISLDERGRLYPVRKSALEGVIDQWVYRREVEGIIGSFEGLESVKYRRATHRETYPGAFRWRSVGELDGTWFNHDYRWLTPSIERLSAAEPIKHVSLPLIDPQQPEVTRQQIRQAIEHPIRDSLSGGYLLAFRANLAQDNAHLSDNLDSLINRCWDGLRVLPYEPDEIISAITNLSTLLLSRSGGSPNVDSWPEIFFGKLRTVETAPIGGHIEAGRVSGEDLFAAMRRDPPPNMTAYMRRQYLNDRELVLDYVTDPWVVFEFDLLRKVFAEQFVPTAVDGFWSQCLSDYDGSLGSLWSISSNVALLGYLTPFEFRFRSPVSGEKDCDQIVFILPDMTRDDLEEIFISCLPSVIEAGKPFDVRFHGYNGDARPIWKIERVIEQAQWIIEVGGISVLSVFPSLTLETGDDLERMSLPVGAFEIWLISKRQLEQVQGKTVAVIQPLLHEFRTELMIANANLDTRARSSRDWPVDT